MIHGIRVRPLVIGISALLLLGCAVPTYQVNVTHVGHYVAGKDIAVRKAAENLPWGAYD